MNDYQAMSHESSGLCWCGPDNHGPERDDDCTSRHPEDPTIRCQLDAGHPPECAHATYDGHWWREEPPVTVCYGPLEFEGDQESNTYRATQWIETRIAPDLTEWQLDLLHRMMGWHQDETRAQLHAAMGYRGRTGRAYMAPAGADPTDTEQWQELGFISTDGLPIDHQHAYQQPAWFDEIHHFRDPGPFEFSIGPISDETAALIRGGTTRQQTPPPPPAWQQPPPPLQPQGPTIPRDTRWYGDWAPRLLERVRLHWQAPEEDDHGIRA